MGRKVPGESGRLSGSSFLDAHPGLLLRCGRAEVAVIAAAKDEGTAAAVGVVPAAALHLAAARRARPAQERCLCRHCHVQLWVECSVEVHYSVRHALWLACLYCADSDTVVGY